MIPSDYVIFLTIYCLIAHSQGQQYYLPQGAQSRFSPSVNFPSPTTNTFQQPGANTFQQSGSNTFQHPGANTFQQSGSNTYQQHGANTFQQSGPNTFPAFRQAPSIYQTNNNRFQPSANDFSSPSSYQSHNTDFQPDVNLFGHNTAVNQQPYLSPASTYQLQPRIEDFFQRNNDYQRTSNLFTFGPPSPPPASLVDQFGSGRRPITETPGPSTYRPRTRPTVAAATTFRPTFRPIGSYSSPQVTTHRPPLKSRLRGIEPTTWAPRNPVLQKKQEIDKTFTRQPILEKTTEASISDQDEEEYDYGKETLDNQESNEKRENEEDYIGESQEELKTSKILHTIGQKTNSSIKQDNLNDRNRNLNSEIASPNHHIKSETSESQEYDKTERSFEEPEDELNYSSERTENIDSNEDQEIYGEEQEDEEEEVHENTSDVAINHLNNENNLPKSNNEDVEENLTIPLSKVKKDSGKTESQMPPPAETSDEEEVTESWLIVASVQTSRSVGEARYLPAGLVQQKEIPKMSLKEVNSSVNSNNNVEQKSIEEEDSSTADNKDENINEQNFNNITTESPSSISIIKANLTTATESLNDHLDWVQSQLSSAFLNGGFNGRPAGPGEMPDILPRDPTTKSGFTISTPPTVKPDKIAKLLASAANDELSGLLPNGFKPRRRRPSAEGRAVGHSDRNAIHVRDPTTTTTPKVIESSNINNKNISFDDLLKNISGKSDLKIENIQVTSSLLPQDYKKGNSSFQIKEASIPSHLLPPGYTSDNSSKNSTTNTRTTSKIHLPNLFPKRTFSQRTKAVSSTTSLPLEIKLRNSSLNIKPAEIPSSLLPPGFKANKSLSNNQSADILASLLPPGYKRSNTLKSDSLGSSKIKINDIPLLLPSNNSKVLSIPVPSSPSPPGLKLLNNSLKITPAQKLPPSLLPPGFKLDSAENTQADQPSIEDILSRIKSSNVPNSLLPKGFNESTVSKEEVPLPPGINSSLNVQPALIPKGLLPPGFVDSSSISTPTTSKPRVVFPNRPGGGTRKPLSKSNVVTSKSNIDGPTPPKPTISKGWPTRATTEFTGWPSPPPPPTTPMPKTSSTSTTTEIPTTLPQTTTPTPSTTPPPPPISTTPGVCRELCELAGTIRLTSGAEWRPELLDHNTIEWQELADQLSEELQEAYTRSLLGHWVKKIRIDSFSQGSILVDFFVELQVPTEGVDTLELRRLFHDALGEVKPPENESITLLEESSALPEPQRLKLGHFELDPRYTDFIVEPPTTPPIGLDIDGEPWLPQWAIAGVVVGLASLLFVSIFGVTVLVSRRRRTKQPPPLTEAMLHEMSKSAGVGYENAALAPPGSTEEYDPWATTDRPLRKTRRPSATLAADSNLYDSWRSEWNGYYYDAYYGVGGGGSGGGGSAGGRRRSDYDTNF